MACLTADSAYMTREAVRGFCRFGMFCANSGQATAANTNEATTRRILHLDPESRLLIRRRRRRRGYKPRRRTECEPSYVTCCDLPKVALRAYAGMRFRWALRTSGMRRGMFR